MCGAEYVDADAEVKLVFLELIIYTYMYEGEGEGEILDDVELVNKVISIRRFGQRRNQ